MSDRDIVTDLRFAASMEDAGPGTCRVFVHEALEAADEIERLRETLRTDRRARALASERRIDELNAQIERLREAVSEAVEFAEQDYHVLSPIGEAMIARWRAALTGQTQEARDE